MTTTHLIFTIIGSLSTVMCLLLIINKAAEIWFDLQACKRDIERLELQIKSLQCNRQ